MLKLTLFVLVCGVVLWGVDSTKPLFKLEHANYYFKDFVTTYNRQYQSEAEKLHRFNIFTKNLHRINKFNAADTAVYNVNKFSDLTTEEFLGIYTGLRNTTTVGRPGGAFCKEVNGGFIKRGHSPDAFDWRDQHVVSPVKDQGGCGSCYAFSSVGNIESLYAIKNNGKILDLAEQELVDCSSANGGCQGGTMAQCMIDVLDLGGLASEEAYPYEQVVGSCKFDKSQAQIQLSGCNHYNLNDENRLKDLLHENGPISIALAAQQFHTYHGGIMQNCPGEVNHAVLLTGYGSENGLDFWNIKNSWGSTWGEQGFVRIARGQNTCRLLSEYTTSAIL